MDFFLYTKKGHVIILIVIVFFILGLFVIDIPFCFNNPNGTVFIAQRLYERSNHTFGLSLSTGETLWGFGHASNIRYISNIPPYNDLDELEILFIVAYQGIHEGDKLRIKYLPTTGLILSIEVKVEPPSITYLQLYTIDHQIFILIIAIIVIGIFGYYKLERINNG